MERKAEEEAQRNREVLRQRVESDKLVSRKQFYSIRKWSLEIMTGGGGECLIHGYAVYPRA